MTSETFFTARLTSARPCLGGQNQEGGCHEIQPRWQRLKFLVCCLFLFLQSSSLVFATAGRVVNGVGWIDHEYDAPFYSFTPGTELKLEVRIKDPRGLNLLVVNNTGKDPLPGEYSNVKNGELFYAKVVTIWPTERVEYVPFVAWYYGGDGNDLELLWPHTSVEAWGYTFNTSPRGGLEDKTVVSLSCGMGYTLALTTEGIVYAWGQNDHGQLGTGDNAPRDEPTAVTGGALEGKKVISVKAGYGTHNLAICSDGTLVSWGNDNWGQLGRGPTAGPARYSNLPVAVLRSNGSAMDASLRVVDIEVGAEHSVVATSNGKVFTWGRNDYGQLGRSIPGAESSNIPVALDDGLYSAYRPWTRVISIATSAHRSYAMSDAARDNLFGWGYNEDERLGSDFQYNRDAYGLRQSLNHFKPELVKIDPKLHQPGTHGSIPPRVVKIAAGSSHVMAEVQIDENTTQFVVAGDPQDGALGYTPKGPEPIDENRPNYKITPGIFLAMANRNPKTGKPFGKLPEWKFSLFPKVLGHATDDRPTKRQIAFEFGLGLALEVFIKGKAGWAATAFELFGYTIDNVEYKSKDPFYGLMESRFHYQLKYERKPRLRQLSGGLNGTMALYYTEAQPEPLPLSFAVAAWGRNDTDQLGFKPSVYAKNEPTNAYYGWRKVSRLASPISLHAAAVQLLYNEASTEPVLLLGYSDSDDPVPMVKNVTKIDFGDVQRNPGNSVTGYAKRRIRLRNPGYKLNDTYLYVQGQNEMNFVFDGPGFADRIQKVSPRSEVEVTLMFTADASTPLGKKTAVASISGQLFPVEANLIDALPVLNPKVFTANTSLDLNELSVLADLNQRFVRDYTLLTNRGYGKLGNALRVGGTSLIEGATVNIAQIPGSPPDPFVLTYRGGAKGNDVVLRWKDRGMAAWGLGSNGQNGNGRTTYLTQPGPVDPTAVLQGQGILQVARGARHTLVLTADRKLYGFGDNSEGQLGLYQVASDDKLVPQQILSLGNGIEAISAGEAHSMALDSQGKLYVWGRNNEGQLGLGDNAPRYFPHEIQSLTEPVRAIAAGGRHSMVLLKSGKVAIWGSDSRGQLGNDAAFESKNTPQLILQTGSFVETIACGQNHSLAVRADGSVHAWGANDRGQLGDGTLVDKALPQPVFTTSGRFKSPTGLAVDSQGNVYVADSENHTIRKVKPSGEISTLAGLAGKTGNADGTGSAARFNFPTSLGIGPTGDIFVTDFYNSVIRKVTPAGVVSTFAGTIGESGQQDGRPGKFLRPQALAVDRTGNITVIDFSLEKIRVVKPDGTIESRKAMAENETELWVNLEGPRYFYVGLANDASGNAYLAEGWRDSIRKVTPAEVISQVKGSDETFFPVNRTHTPLGMAVAGDGKLYIADPGMHVIRQLTNSGLSTILAGSEELSGISDGLGANARFNQPAGLALDSEGNLYVADREGKTIRKVTRTGVVTTLAGTPGKAGHSDGIQHLDRRRVQQVVAGGDHNLLLCTDGSLWSWGANGSGQLGIGTQSDARIPIEIPRANTALDGKTVTDLATGLAHSMALCSDGSLTSWGDNSVGQLGTVEAVSKSVPTSVDASGASELTGAKVSQLSNGPVSNHSMVLYFGGSTREIEVREGGSELVDGASSVSFGTVGFEAAASGVDRIFSIANTGNRPLSDMSAMIVGPGADDYDIITPVPNAVQSDRAIELKVRFVPSAAGVRNATLRVFSNDLDENPFDVALTATYNAVFNLAFNQSGQDGFTSSQLGNANGIPLNLTLNYPPVGGDNLTVIRNHSQQFIQGEFAGVPNGGTVSLSFGGQTYRFKAWYYGGDGNDLVLLWENTGLAMWGGNGQGQLGRGFGTGSTVPAPVDVSGPLAGKTLVDLRMGLEFTLALTTEGKVYAWGSNSHGQLGDGTTTNRLSPVEVPLLPDFKVVAISAGARHSLALLADGRMIAWGANDKGQIGNSGGQSMYVLPERVGGINWSSLPAITAIAAGGQHNLALTAAGRVLSWGANDSGQLGCSQLVEQSGAPVDVSDFQGDGSALAGRRVIELVAGSKHSVAQLDNGGLAGWGRNANGQLGAAYNASGQYRIPTPVLTQGTALQGKQVMAISAGANHTLAQCTDGTLVAWGYNGTRALGTGGMESMNQNKAVRVIQSGTSSLSGRSIKSFAAAGSHSFAIDEQGEAHGWGLDYQGALGINAATFFQASPVRTDTGPASLLRGRKVTSLAQGGAGILPPVSLGLSLLPLESGYHSGAIFLRAGKASLMLENIYEGQAYNMTYSPNITVNFGTAHIDTTQTTPGTTFRVSNVGDLPLTLYGVSLSGADTADFVVTNSPNLVLESGASTEFILYFRPKSFGAKSATATLGSNNPGIYAFPIDLTGTYSAEVTATITNDAVPVKVISSNDALNLDGMHLNLTLGVVPTPGMPLTIIRNDGMGPVRGSMALWPNGTRLWIQSELGAGFVSQSYNYRLWYHGGDGNDVVAWPEGGLAVATFGQNTRGQLGDGTQTARNNPGPIDMDVHELTGADFLQLSVGESHTIGVASHSAFSALPQLFTWGDNTYGQLGIGDPASAFKSRPTLVSQAAMQNRQVKETAAGARHSLVLCSDGTLWAWGDNSYGQLGNGTTTRSDVPVRVSIQSGQSALAGKTIQSISAGAYHNAVLCTDGEVVTWGRNESGQLGDNSLTNRLLPVLVARSPGTGSELQNRKVTAVSAGGSHTLAICADDQKVAAWGDNQYGQLGLGHTTNQQVPRMVSDYRTPQTTALSNKLVMNISAGGSHSLALCSDGTLAAWGRNYNGQLGDGTFDDRNLPVAVSKGAALTGKSIVSLSAGAYHSTSFQSDGSVAGWGFVTSSTPTPLLLNTLTSPNVLSAGKAVAVAKGAMASHRAVLTCAAPPKPVVDVLEPTVTRLADNGPAVNFGEVLAGQTRTLRLTNEGSQPLHVKPLMTKSGDDPDAFTLLQSFPPFIMPGQSASVAISFSPAGPGTRDAYLQIEMPVHEKRFRVPLTATLAPTLSSTFLSASAPGQTISTSQDVPLNGVVLNMDLRFAPTIGTTLTAVNNTGSGVFLGEFANVPNGGVVRLSHGGVEYPFIAWYTGGDGNDLVLLWPQTGLATWGNGTTTPAAVDQTGALLGKTIVSASRGHGHFLVLTSDGKVVAWGDNNRGQLGNGNTTAQTVPVAVSTVPGSALAGRFVNYIMAGATHSLAICSDGTVVEWGNDALLPAVVPVAGTPLAGKRVVSLAAGRDFTIALASDGTLASRGLNTFGALGDNTTNSRANFGPVLLTGPLTGKLISAISAGEWHALALTTDGVVAAWGYGDGGRLGRGNQNSSLFPIPVSTTAPSALAGKVVTGIVAGYGDGLALTADGTLAAWGIGWLGNGSSSMSDTPVAVTMTGALAGKTVAQLSGAGSLDRIVRLVDGTLAGWGQNDAGELGVGDLTQRLSPVVAASGGVLASRKVTQLASGYSGGSYPTSLAIYGMGLPEIGVFAGTVGTGTELADGTSRHTFANTLVSAPTTQLFTVRNTGQETLFGLSLSISGAGAGSFTTSALGSTSLAPNATTTFNVTFTPASLGTQSAVVSLGSSDVDENPFDIAVEGVGISPEIEVFDGFTPAPAAALTSAGSTVVWPALDTGASSTKTFTIRNAGNSPLTGLALSKSGTNQGDFSLSALAGSTLAPGATSTFTVTFQPVAGGTRAALLSLASSDLDENPFTITLSGSSVQYGGTNLGAVFNNTNDVGVTASGYNATSAVVSLGLGHAPQGTTLTVINNTSNQYITGEFANLPNGSTVDLSFNGTTYPFVAWYYGGDGNDLVLLWARTGIAAWGYNGFGTIGDGTSSPGLAPASVDMSGALAGKTIVQVVSGAFFMLALTTEGKVYSWGSAYEGELGDGSTTGRNLPGPVDAGPTSALFGKRVIAISAGLQHALALCSDGTVASWGRNEYGQCGDGSRSMRTRPVAVITASGGLAGKTVRAVSAGSGHSIALATDGSLSGWGRAFSLGMTPDSADSVMTPRNVPTAGTGLAGKTISAISAGGGHTMVLNSDGTVACWGRNEYGQLGNGTTTFSNTPVLVGGGYQFKSISAGGSFSLAVTTSNWPMAWGDGRQGQLGEATNQITTPSYYINIGSSLGFPVSSPPHTQISASGENSYAIWPTGSSLRLAAWGQNASGQLGDNQASTTSFSWYPVAVRTSGVLNNKTSISLAQGCASYSGGVIYAETAASPFKFAASSVVEGASAGNDSILLTASSPSASWSASSNAAWLTLTNTSGTGNGRIDFSYTANTGATREGVITAAGRTFTVTQAGATYVEANPITTLATNAGYTHVAVDYAGNVTYMQGGTLRRWTQDSNTTGAITAEPASEGGVAVDGAGNPFFTNNSHQVRRLRANGTVDTLASNSNFNIVGPNSLAWDGSALYFTTPSYFPGNEGRLFRWINGSVSELITYNNGLNRPAGLSVNAHGDVFISDNGLNLVRVWNRASQSQSTVISSGLSSPRGIAVAPSGNLFVANPGSGDIRLWRASSAVITPFISGLSDPHGVALDAQGNLFFTEGGTGALKVRSRVFVDTRSRSLPSTAGTDVLTEVLPLRTNLRAPFAPTSNAAWLTFGTLREGRVPIAFTANSGAPRTATVTLFGQTISVTQNGPSAPTMSDPTVASVSTTSAIMSGVVQSDNGTAITERGIVYSLTSANANPLIGGSGVTKVTSGGTTGLFSITQSALSPGTGYTFKAYAINAMGTSYTAAAAFTTVSTNADLASLTLSSGALNSPLSPPFLPATTSYAATVSTATSTISVTATTASTAATIQVNNVSLASGATSAGIPLASGNNTISVLVTAQSGAKRTYSINVQRLAAPLVLQPSFSNLTATSVNLGGQVERDGGSAISERGVVLAPTTATLLPTIGGAGVVKITTGGTTGSFTVTASGLTPATGYVFRAYATNSAGTGYSQPASLFVTPSNNANLISLTTNVGVMSPSGTVFSSSVTQYQMYVSESTSAITITCQPELSSATVSHQGQIFSSTKTVPLVGGRNFIPLVVKAQDQTTTKTYTLEVIRPALPQVGAPTHANILTTTAVLGGTILNDGGHSIEERGVVIAPQGSPPPTVDSSFAINAVSTSETSVFTANATGLTPGVVYIYRAYAKGYGTGYSAESSFTTRGDVQAHFAAATDVPMTVGGFVATGGTLTLSFGFLPPIGQTMMVLRNNGSGLVTGTFTGLPEGSSLTCDYLTDVLHFEISYTGGDGNDITLTRILGPGQRPSVAIWQTLAGKVGVAGSVDAGGADARFSGPAGIAAGPLGQMYVADRTGHTIRCVTASGIVTTLAGSPGVSGTANGTGSAARFSSPGGLVVDAGGDIYVADEGNHAIRKITPQGVVTTFAGLPGTAGAVNATGSAARFNRPAGIALGTGGTLYVSELGNHGIRKITSAGVVTTLAGGSGLAGYIDGIAGAARFSSPGGLAVGTADVLYVADTENHCVRQVTQAGVVTTLAGRGESLIDFMDSRNGHAIFRHPRGIAVAADGGIYVADSSNHLIRKIWPSGLVTTVGGSSSITTGVDGIGAAASFMRPYAVAALAGNRLAVVDLEGHRVIIGSPTVMPAVAAAPYSNVGPTSATLNPVINPNGMRTTAEIRYGTTRELGTTVPFTLSPDSGTQEQTIPVPIAGLLGRTTYYFQIAASNLEGTAKTRNQDYVVTPDAPSGQKGAGSSVLGVSQTFSFSTPAGPPVLAALNIADVTATTATLTASIDHDGGEAVFERGFVFAFQASVPNPVIGGPGVTKLVSTADFSSQASGLSAGVAYAVKAYATNSVGTAYSGVSTLTPLENLTAIFDSGSSLPVTAEEYTAANRQLTLQLGFDPSPGQIITLVSNTGNTAISGTFTGLAEGATVTTTFSGNTYVFQISYTGGDGNDITLHRLLAPAQVAGPLQWRTLAGSPGGAGTADGTGRQARLNKPRGSAFDASGNLYLVDSGNHVIRKMTPAGVITTLAGLAGTAGSEDGTGNTARFNRPEALVIAASGLIYVTDSGNHTIRSLTMAGEVTTLAGLAETPGAVDGTGAQARFNRPKGLAMGDTGNVLVVDSVNHAIRQVTPAGVVTTFAGQLELPGTDDGTGSAAGFYFPAAMAALPGGGFVIADSGSHTLRVMTAAGVVSTLAGTAGEFGNTDGNGIEARFLSPASLTVDGTGIIYVADSQNHSIRRVTPAGEVTTLAGIPGTPGTDDGPGTEAFFNTPEGIAWKPDGTLFVSDTNNHTLRRVTLAGVVTTLAGETAHSGVENGASQDARFNFPTSLAVGADGAMVVVDQFNHTVRRISTGGAVSTMAGSAGNPGTVDGLAATARFSWPMGIAVNTSGQMILAEAGAHSIRAIAATGTVSTLAGTAGISGSTDATGPEARFFNPAAVAMDSSGNSYIADFTNHIIRKMTPLGEVTTLAGLAETDGSADGAGADARFFNPSGIALAAGGVIYVCDESNHTIRKITPAGVVTTIAGLAANFGSADGNGASARFRRPRGITVDGSGVLWVADTGNHTIRRVTPSGDVTTVGGMAGQSGSREGSATNALFSSPSGITMDSAGRVYVADTANHRIVIGSPTARPMVSLLPGVIGSSEATLKGLVNPNGFATLAQFRFGNTPDMASSVPLTLASANGTAAQTVTTVIGGLSPDTTYYYALVATNADGTVSTETNSFTTPTDPVGLISLTLNDGILSPTFATATTSYGATVPNATTSLTVTPTKSNPAASIEVRVNGGAFSNVASGFASGALALNVGTNIVDVRVTAANGTTARTYTVSVVRSSPPTVTVIQDDFDNAALGTNPNGIGTGFTSRGQGAAVVESGGFVNMNSSSGYSTMVVVSNDNLNPFQAGVGTTATFRFGNITYDSSWHRLWLGYRRSTSTADHLYPDHSNEHGLYVSIFSNNSGIDTYNGNLIARSSTGVRTVLASWSWSNPAQLSNLSVTLTTTSSTYELGFSGAAATPTFQVGAASGALTGLGTIGATTFKVGVHNQTDSGGTTGAVLFDSMLVQAVSGVAPEIVVKGAGNVISDDDSSPGSADFTDFGGSPITGGTVARAYTVENLGTSLLLLTGTPLVAVSGDHAADFSVAALPASAISAGGSPSGFQIIFNPSARGLRTATVSIAHNDGDENPYNFSIQGIGYTATEDAAATWAASHLGISGADTAPMATPFNDGVPNLLKYAFNIPLTGPNVAPIIPGTSSGGLPAMGVNNTSGVPDSVRIEFIRRKNSGLIYTPQYAYTLTSFVPTTATPVVTSIDANWERVVVEQPLAPGQAAAFCRVAVTAP
jgi:alpha-tubulin suppressor-like RCC1 family protein